jgi:asparagine synthase (glutamine-hydrolysing)
MLLHSAVPNHLVATLAREHVKAVLIGEGADEIFAGYSHYAEHESGEELREDLLETIRGLHNLGLQRVDRVTSANGIEARIPFLDLDVPHPCLCPRRTAACRARAGRAAASPRRRAAAATSRGAPPSSASSRAAARTPARPLSDHFGATVTDQDLERERDAVDPPLRTREELAYYRIFREHLPGVLVKQTIGRFVEA